MTNKQTGIYLDYNATAPLRPHAAQAMSDAMMRVGNPSSVHGFGRAVRKDVEKAREIIGKMIGVHAVDVTFTSGATEANNTVIFGAPVTRVLCSAIEHPSVLDTVTLCKNHAIIPVLSSGVVDLEALENMLQNSDEKTLVSVMWVNNETGVIQPVKQIATLTKKYGALFHCDAVQAVGRFAVDMHAVGMDYLTCSAHKIGGPSGIGALVYGQHTSLEKMIHGGGQERRRRAGTENVLGIIGFGAAAQDVLNDIADGSRVAELTRLRDMLEARLLEITPEGVIIGQDAPRIAGTTQIIVPHVASEKQLMALDLAGIAVSSGSACSSGSIKPSNVLTAMGVPEGLARCAIRISTGWNTTEQDVTRFLEAWVTISQRLLAS